MSTTAVSGGTVEVSTGVSLAYRSAGEGPPLVLIMGTTGSMDLWGQSVSALATKHRVVTFDNRGMGGSGRGKGELSMALMAEDVAALMDALGIEQADVLGWSLGSCVAQELALAHPERIGALILFGTWDHVDGFQSAMFTALGSPWRTGDMDRALEAVGLAFSPEFLDSPDFGAALGSMAGAFPQTQDQVAVTVEQWEADMSHDTRGRLEDIDMPTLVIVGEQDMLTPPWQSRKVADAIPGAQFHLFTGPGSSHALNLERPDEFAGVVLDFLERSPLR